MSPNIWFYGAFGLLVISGALHLVIDILMPLLRSAAFSLDTQANFIGMHAFYAVSIMGLGLINLYLLKTFPAIFNDAVVIGIYIGIGALYLMGAVMFLGVKPPVVTMLLFLVLTALGRLLA